MFPDPTDLWLQQEEIHLYYTGLPTVAYYIFSLIPHSVRVEATFSLGPDLSAEGSEKQPARPFAKKSLQECLLNTVMRYW